MLNWVNPKLTLDNDHWGGRGLFALETITSSELLIIFGGYVISLDTYHTMSEKLKSFHYQVQDRPVLLYGPVSEDQLDSSDHVNHSCNPSAGFAGTIHLVAMRDILPGDEITFDYATCMTNSFGNMECSCNSAGCRQYITGEDWRIESLQIRYQGYFQPYIENLIKASQKLKT